MEVERGTRENGTGGSAVAGIALSKRALSDFLTGIMQLNRVAVYFFALTENKSARQRETSFEVR